jgi:predicted tellurium resistance membrane protein TerC
MEKIQKHNAVTIHKVLISLLTMIILYMAINIFVMEISFLNYLYLEILFSISRKMFNLATDNII